MRLDSNRLSDIDDSTTRRRALELFSSVAIGTGIAASSGTAAASSGGITKVEGTDRTTLVKQAWNDDAVRQLFTYLETEHGTSVARSDAQVYRTRDGIDVVSFRPTFPEQNAPSRANDIAVTVENGDVVDVTAALVEYRFKNPTRTNVVTVKDGDVAETDIEFDVTNPGSDVHDTAGATVEVVNFDRETVARRSASARRLLLASDVNVGAATLSALSLRGRRTASQAVAVGNVALFFAYTPDSSIRVQ